MKLIELLKSSQYISLNKEMIRRLGLNESIIITTVINYKDYENKKEILLNEYYFKVEYGLNRVAFNNAIKRLESIDLIKIIKKGMPCKRYIVINEQKIINCIYAKRREEYQKKIPDIIKEFINDIK